MSESPISDAIALRIALAARTLPDMGAARLIRVIEDAIGLPPTAKKLGGLKVKDLKTALGGELAEVDTDALKAAVAILKGEANADAPPPPVEPYTEGDMPDSIRVACASDSGELLDGHCCSKVACRLKSPPLMTKAVVRNGRPVLLRLARHCLRLTSRDSPNRYRN
jgi:hypothetical protein